MAEPDLDARIAEIDAMVKTLDRQRNLEGRLSGPMEGYLCALREHVQELRERRASGSLPNVR